MKPKSRKLIIAKEKIIRKNHPVSMRKPFSDLFLSTAVAISRTPMSQIMPRTIIEPA